MPEAREPLVHLLRAAEELLRAAADGASLAAQTLPALGPNRGRLARLLRDECERWAARARNGDAAAEQVREIFDLLADILEEPEAQAAPAGDEEGDSARESTRERSRRPPSRQKQRPQRGAR